MDLEFSYALQQFELFLLKVHGDEFQNFFSGLMERRYPGDFTRVKPHGNKGDGGCDGWRDSAKVVYQCYAPKTVNINTLEKKISEDFEKAKAKWSSMEEWSFVHNFYDGIPAPALSLLNKIQDENPKIKISKMSPSSLKGIFEELIKEDFSSHTHAIIGPVPSQKTGIDLTISDVENVIIALSAIVDGDGTEPEIKPVTNQKLDWNNLSSHKKSLIIAGREHFGIVNKYFRHGIDADMGERIAQTFRDKYQKLKSFSHTSDYIFDSLFEFSLGQLTPEPKNIVSVQAVLSYFFDACDIFEDVPEEKLVNVTP